MIWSSSPSARRTFLKTNEGTFREKRDPDERGQFTGVRWAELA